MGNPRCTAEELRTLLDYSPDTGLFAWRMKRGRMMVGSNAGHAKQSDGYIYIFLKRRLYLAHRLAWLHIHGAWPLAEIDHVNGNKSDNRLCNLRDVSRNVNAQNVRSALARKSPGLLGTSYNKARRKWVASVKMNGKNHHLGTFTTTDEAHAAYLSAKRKIHEGCTI